MPQPFGAYTVAAQGAQIYGDAEAEAGTEEQKTMTRDRGSMLAGGTDAAGSAESRRPASTST